MTARRYWIGLAILSLLASSLAALGQTVKYPEKPVTIISDAPPGSTPDVDARFIAAGLSKVWGQQAVIINHAGANGSIAARAASEATPDGYTLFMPALSTFVAPQSVAPNIPGTISIAVTGVGRLTHLTGLLLQQRAGIEFLPVPYNAGPAAALSDVAAGRVSMIIEGYSGIVGAVKAGQVKLIAVAAAQRLPQFPDLPTVAETIPGFSATGWQVLVAPLGTPAAIIDKVDADLAKVVSDPDFQKLLANVGSYSHAMNAKEALAFVEQQQATWLPVLEKIPVK
jgi:tripartite-type tricarboxylate transporter receptor subunit TctC